jgi:hypothetical protein
MAPFGMSPDEYRDLEEQEDQYRREHGIYPYDQAGLIEEIDHALRDYRTRKTLEGRGLEDDPEWVDRLESIISGREY